MWPSHALINLIIISHVVDSLVVRLEVLTIMNTCTFYSVLKDANTKFAEAKQREEKMLEIMEQLQAKGNQTHAGIMA